MIQGAPKTLDGLKRRAKKVKKERDITHQEALLVAARQMGYVSYEQARKALSQEHGPAQERSA